MTYYNFVKETCTGTGAEITLLGAVPGFLSFGDVSFEGDNFAYVIVDADGQRKVTGTAADFFYPDTMFRNDTWAFDGTEVVADPSVNITLSGGTHTIYCAESAEQLETILSRIGLAESGLLQRRKNLIINGNFDVWQRGTSFVAPAGNSYTADRWRLSGAGGSEGTYSRQAFPPGDDFFRDDTAYFLRCDRPSAATADTAIFQQRIEDVRWFNGQTVTISFWIKADSSKTFQIEIDQDFGTGGTPSARVTTVLDPVTTSTFWQKIERTFVLPSIFGKTLGTTDNSYIQFNIIERGTYAPFILDIAQVQFERGFEASDFEKKTYAEELRDCQRYYQRMNIDGAGSGSTLAFLINANLLRGLQRFTGVMRTAPTVSLTNFASLELTTSSGNFTLTNGNLAASSATHFLWNSGTTTGPAGVIGYIRKNTNPAVPYVEADAEL